MTQEAILQFLTKHAGQKFFVKQIAKCLDMTSSSTSKKCMALRGWGRVKLESKGRKIYYWVEKSD